MSNGASLRDRVLSPSATEPEVSARSGNAPLRDSGREIASRLLRERDLRSRYLPSAFASGASWDILLDLYRSEPQRVSSVCYGSGAAYTTALRHVHDLEFGELIRRTKCRDKRGSLLSLSAWVREQLGAYLDAIAAATGTAKTPQAVEKHDD